MSKTDWLGQEYDVGDTVIWAASSGRSITMCIGTIVKFNDSGTVTVQPTNSSRWTQHSETEKYIDSRTGKKIFAYSGGHIERDGHWLMDDGTELSYYEYQELMRVHRWQTSAQALVKYIPTQFKDYVQKVVIGPKPVTLRVTENIIKWTGV